MTKKIALIFIFSILHSTFFVYAQPIHREVKYYEGFVDGKNIGIELIEGAYENDSDTRDSTKYFFGNLIDLNDYLSYSFYENNSKKTNHHHFLIIDDYFNNEENYLKLKVEEPICSGELYMNGKRSQFQLKASEQSIVFNDHYFEQITKYKNMDKISYQFTMYWKLPKDEKFASIIINDITEGEYSKFDKMTNSRWEHAKKNYLELIEEEDKSYNISNNEDEIWMYNFEDQFNLTPYLVSEDLLILGNLYYHYSGGAHGIHHISYYNYDVKKRELIKLSDILDFQHKDRISSLIKRTIKKKHNIPDNVKLDESDKPFLTDNVEMPENFTLSKKGITFHFGLYELTPYAAGMYEILVPFEHLLPFMKKKFELPMQK